MAEMIPDQLPRRASRGEERLFDVLKRLPDDYIVHRTKNKKGKKGVTKKVSGPTLIHIDYQSPNEVFTSAQSGVLVC